MVIPTVASESIPTGFEDGPRAAGVVIDPFAVFAAAVETQNNDTLKAVPVPIEFAVPPAVLLPRFPREPFRLDTRFPPHPRGLGMKWPPESRIEDGKLPGRFPLALAWSEFANNSSSSPWSLPYDDGMSGQCSCVDVIAAAFVESVRSIKNSVGAPVLVVPNDASMARQQELIDACRHQGKDVKLLWRPIAAALAWCESIVKNDDASLYTAACDDPGILITIHLGLDQFEITCVDLILRSIKGRQYLLPARKRPTRAFRAEPSFGLNAVFRAAGVPSERTNRQSAWAEAWGSATLIQALLNQERAAVAATGNRRAMDFCQEQLPETVDPFKVSGGGNCQQVLQEKIDAVRGAMAGIQSAGIVITGSLSHWIQADGRPLWKHVVQRLAPKSRDHRIVVDAPFSTRQSILATGAALFAGRLARKEPTYLDTLPKLSIAAYVLGTPAWIPLLADDDTFVEGGKVWNRPKPITGFAVNQGMGHLEVTLSHEEYPTARSVRAEFPSPTTIDLNVKLSVSVEPAQGNAKVEVVPEVKGVLKSSRLLLEWRKMTVLKQSPDEWLGENCPTLFPAILRRAASQTLWGKVRTDILRFLQLQTESNLEQLVSSLRNKQDSRFRPSDLEEEKPTAISSDGIPANGVSTEVAALVDFTVDRLRNPRRRQTWFSENLIRAVGYTATASAPFEALIKRWIEHHGSSLEPHELVACGQCLRTPDLIALFAEKLDAVLRVRIDGRTNWIKAFAEMLRYRDAATQRIETERCHCLARPLLQILKKEIEAEKIEFTFNYAALAIAFLLRRRAYDDDFLRPGTEAYRKVRDAFVEAQTTVEQMRHANAQKARKTISLLLRYLDREGPSILSGGAELRELID
ncbi:MAG: hypothetical protein JNM43_15130 [Planctomycetaceae bacterium]|nr:hypothetical protein [Planctomycetaceae bacterium]